MEYRKLKSLVKSSVLSAGLVGSSIAYGLDWHLCDNGHLHVGDYCIHCDHYGEGYRSPFIAGAPRFEFPGADFEAILPWILRINNVEVVQYLLMRTLASIPYRFQNRFDVILDRGTLRLVVKRPDDNWNLDDRAAGDLQVAHVCRNPDIFAIKESIGDFLIEVERGRYNEAHVQRVVDALVQRLRDLYPEVRFHDGGTFVNIYEDAPVDSAAQSRP